MEKKDFFVSYNKANKEWAKWIAGTLEENGYTVYVQAWDIVPGDDFIEKMNKFLQCSKSYIAVLSNDFWNSEYCRKEFQTAFNEHLCNRIEKFLPIRVENVLINPLYETIVYIDLYKLEELKATQVLLNGVGYDINPRKKGKFPGSRMENSIGHSDSITDKLLFPGNNLSKKCDFNYQFVSDEKILDIIILENENNRKGDLFNRLVYDVFHTLGFGESRYNITRSGREIDMILKHRTEKRIAIVESKAIKDKVGGTDINKFIGVFDVERGKYEQEGYSVVGYYISKSGFTVTAIEQEEERRKSRDERGEKNELILLGPNEIAEELIQGNVLCSLERAINAIHIDSTLLLCEKRDLIACEYGWIWVLYYSEYPKQTATHFAFVHADGHQLLNEMAEKIIKASCSRKYAFSNLIYIKAVENSIIDTKTVQDAYYQYLENELGEIQFEGMPTDKEAGAVKVNLESIFVPLRFKCEIKNRKDESYGIKEMSISGVLNRTLRAAILAKPGGGKSTLIRRIALAYAFPERRKRVDDGLPNYDWFPVYIRCRDIGEDITKSILEIIGTVVQRAEITKYKDDFKILIEDMLQKGKLLLLIDGLDEISAERQRICFVNQLRTFIATYPTVHLVITSREAGFRAVAGNLAGYCEQYSIANLEETEIRHLSLKWHQAILGVSEQTENDSDRVCNIILNDSRITALAENPLLLTTLLFVKRWVGYLPTKKCRLYEEMIKLLLVTWNAAGHEKLDMDESEPQLAFVAYHMTMQGHQKITRDELEKCIIAARKVLPELLSYTTLSPSKFIDQVEERSSLLIQLGLEENEKGKLVPSYEFSHLSFQEYLTAKAIAESWIPDADNCNLLEILKPHIDEEHWKEVIPLATVAAGRQAKQVIEYLIQMSMKSEEDDEKENVASFHLANCIASEVPMSQDLLKKAIVCVVNMKKNIDIISFRFDMQSSINVFNTIIKSKYGSNYKEAVEEKLFSNLEMNYIHQYSNAWIEICISEYDKAITQSDVLELLSCDDYKNRITGMLLMMHLAFEYSQGKYKKLGNKERNEVSAISEEIFTHILRLLQTDDRLSVFSAAWCIAWSGYNDADIIPRRMNSHIADRLISLWLMNIDETHVKRVISWALCSICMPGLKIGERDGLREKIESSYYHPENNFDRTTAIQMAILLKLWAKEKIRKRIREESNSSQIRIHNTRFLRECGYDKDINRAISHL